MTEPEVQTQIPVENQVEDDDGVLMDGEPVLGISNAEPILKAKNDFKKDTKKRPELADGVVTTLQEILGIVYLPDVPDATTVPDPVIRAERTSALKNFLSDEGLYDGSGGNEDETRKKLEEAREAYMGRYMAFAQQLSNPEKKRSLIGQQRQFDLAGGGKLIIKDSSNATETKRFVGVVGVKITPEVAKTLVQAAKMANLEPLKIHGGKKNEKEMIWLAAMNEGMEVKGFTPSEKFLKENNIDKFGNKTEVAPAPETVPALAAPESTVQEPEAPDAFFDRVGAEVAMPDIRILDALEKARTEKQKNSLVKIEVIATQDKIKLLNSLHDGLSHKDLIGQKEIQNIREAYDAGAYSQAASIAKDITVNAGVISKDGKKIERDAILSAAVVSDVPVQKVEKDITAQSELISKKPLTENTQAQTTAPKSMPKAQINFTPKAPTIESS